VISPRGAQSPLTAVFTLLLHILRLSALWYGQVQCLLRSGERAFPTDQDGASHSRAVCGGR